MSNQNDPPCRPLPPSPGGHGGWALGLSPAGRVGHIYIYIYMHIYLSLSLSLSIYIYIYTCLIPTRPGRAQPHPLGARPSGGRIWWPANIIITTSILTIAIRYWYCDYVLLLSLSLLSSLLLLLSSTWLQAFRRQQLPLQQY